AAAGKFAQALFDASRHWSLAFHFNKGQSGAAAEALARDRETSVNPPVYDAAALIIAGAGGDSFTTTAAGREPNEAGGQAERAQVSAAMKIMRDDTPGAGSDVNKTHYFDPTR